jgi:hypothetical protein
MEASSKDEKFKKNADIFTKKEKDTLFDVKP